MPVVHAQEEKEYFMAEGCYILELNNHLSDPAVSIARARLEVGKTTHWHSLKDITERYVILQGQAKVFVGNEPPAMVKEQDVVYIPAGSAQRIRNTGQQDLIFLAICSPRFVESAYHDLQTDSS